MFDKDKLKKYLDDNGIKQKYVAKRAGSKIGKRYVYASRRCENEETWSVYGLYNSTDCAGRGMFLLSQGRALEGFTTLVGAAATLVFIFISGRYQGSDKDGDK